MLYLLAQILNGYYSFFNVFKYLTFRSCGALFSSFFICMYLMPKLIKFCQNKQSFYQPIRDDGPATHVLDKQKVPSMGGIVMIISLISSVLLWGNPQNNYLWILIFVTVIFGVIGFYDDYSKVVKNNVKGISAKKKFCLQIICAFTSVILINWSGAPSYSNFITIPFFKATFIDLGWFYLIFAIVVIVGSSNAVNLTDGLDGLAIGPILILSAVFALIAYLVGNLNFSEYLKIIYVYGASDIAVFCAALIGAGLGFLWYNSYPAKIFMGDTGSLSLGAIIGVISIIIKQELVLFIAGFIFVIEAISVILQVASFKLRQKRILRMAPIHHHLEKLGWSETTIVIRFWILSLLFALVALVSLKIR